MVRKEMWQRLLALLVVIALGGVIYVLSMIDAPRETATIEMRLIDRADSTGGDRSTEPHERSAEASGVASTTVDDPALEAAVPVMATARPFDQYRIARLQGRSRQIEYLQSVLSDQSLSPHDRAEFAAALFDLVELAERERGAEGLLVARGLRDAIVYLNKDSAEVILLDPITNVDAQRVGELVARIGGVPMERITIIDGSPLE